MSEISADSPVVESSQVPLVRWKRWVPLVGAVIAVGLLVVVDGRLKKSSTQGFSVQHAEWSISADNVAVAWQSLYSTDAWETLSKEGNPVHNDLIELRKQLEMRVSPEHWNTWMGSGATISGVGDEWLLVTHPGVLVRIFDTVRGSSGPSESKRYGLYYYRWHEGYLCISKSRELLARVKADTITMMPRIDDEEAVVLQGGELHCTLRMVDTLPLHGEWAGSKDSPPLEFSDSKPFSIFPLLADYTPAWEIIESTAIFQGSLSKEIEAYSPESKGNGA